MNSEQKKILLQIARQSVEVYVKRGEVLDFKIDDELLNKKQGAFVTLHMGGKLRGCIGQIIPTDMPLWQVVRDMAIEAATGDSRFNQVSEKELEKLEYEISILTPPKKIDDWRKIRLGVHGVIVRKGYQAGVFLPQVATETGWTLEEFLANLCEQKAGLACDAYKNDPEAILEVFEAEVVG